MITNGLVLPHLLEMLLLENQTISPHQLITCVCPILWSSDYISLYLLLFSHKCQSLKNGIENSCIWRCTDGESCKRQIAEDFQNERPLWKLTCYGHSKRYAHIWTCHYAKILFWILLFRIIFFSTNESCSWCLLIFYWSRCHINFFFLIENRNL